jgi:hypothetical protein
VLSSAANALEFSFGKRYLDYGNGAINLDNVTYINPEIKHVLTVASDSPDSYLQEYHGSIPHLGVISEWFDESVHAHQYYYYYEIGAIIRFDQFELTVMEERRFLKLPTDQEELGKTLDVHGDDFHAFLEALQMRLFALGIIGEVLTEEQDLRSYGDRYFQIVQEIPQLDNDSASSVQSQLSRMGDMYRQIVD